MICSFYAPSQVHALLKHFFCVEYGNITFVSFKFCQIIFRLADMFLVAVTKIVSESYLKNTLATTSGFENEEILPFLSIL